MIALLVIALSVASHGYSRTENYDGQVIARCQLNQQNVNNFYNEFVHEIGLDVWRHTIDNVVDIRIPANFLQAEGQKLNSICSVIHEDVEALIKEFEVVSETARTEKEEWFEAYHTYEEIKEWYQDLASSSNLVQFYPSVGKSEEGRDIFAITLTGNKGGNKLNFFMQCQIHAREWISGATCGYIVNDFMEKYGSDQNITRILDESEIFLIPIINPDGYAYTWSDSRLWRKNRATNSGSSCKGVDINRNYNSHWGEGGSSSNPCSDTYKGPSPNSELEAKTTIDNFFAHAPVLGSIDMHAYSQLILRPWGWTRNNSPDEAQLRSIGDSMATAIFNNGGARYSNIKSIELYVTTGTTSDWFYDDEATAGNKGYRSAGYTLELRDTGRYGFLLPPEYIIPSGIEISAAYQVFCLELLNNPIRA